MPASLDDKLDALPLPFEREVAGVPAPPTGARVLCLWSDAWI